MLLNNQKSKRKKTYDEICESCCLDAERYREIDRGSKTRDETRQAGLDGSRRRQPREGFFSMFMFDALACPNFTYFFFYLFCLFYSTCSMFRMLYTCSLVLHCSTFVLRLVVSCLIAYIFVIPRQSLIPGPRSSDFSDFSSYFSDFGSDLQR